MTEGLALATRGLQKRYGSRAALAGLDLSVPAGVVYGFLGPNGAGKTTTMRLLTGLIHPDAGTIEFLGRSFGRRDRHHLFDVGALIESPSFYPYLSARDNLRSLAATGARTSRARIEELLELVGLRDRARDKVQTYSLGMKQRLGIAAALLSDPRLLLLDEPSNGLDPAGIVAMRETLKQLAATGKTVFVSSHILGEVRQLADVVGIIAAGRLVREGPLEQLLQGEGVIRVRVGAAEIAPATAILGALVPGALVPGALVPGALVPGPSGPTVAGDDGWISLRAEPDRAAEIAPATAILGALVPGALVPGALVPGPSGPTVAGDDGWISLRAEPDRAAEVNRALATAGIYASGLETGSDLESLFLELTGDPSGGHEGTFGVAGGNVPPAGTVPPPRNVPPPGWGGSAATGGGGLG